MLDHDELDQVDYPEDPPNAVLRYIKDPIHDYIPINRFLSRFIDTKQFQRLRNIKQLGTTSYVWPGASHTRFEHSLGVAFLSRLMATHLQKSQPELKITDRDINCVEIAGLCHDLGHGPWSHVWDGMFIPVAMPDAKWKHEHASEMMFKDMVGKNKIPISKEDQDFVLALIAGEHLRVPHEKGFLFDIVANKRNGLDVDKFDYIHRDSHMIGDPIHLSLDRLVHSARVLDDQICYDIKDANQIYEIYQTRFKLHKLIYNHKTAKAIEYMIIDGLLAAQPHLKIAERIMDPNKFLHLTDVIMPLIEASEEPELEKARKIFDRIHERKLYQCVDFKVIDWPHRDIFRANVTTAAIVREAKALRLSAVSTPVHERTIGINTENQVDVEETLNTSTSAVSLIMPTDEAEELSEEDVIVDFSMMHYGKRQENPLDSVRFYSKRNMKQSQKAERGVYSNLKPQYFAEDLLRVYTKKPQFFGLVQAGYRAVLVRLGETTANEQELTGLGLEFPSSRPGADPSGGDTDVEGDDPTRDKEAGTHLQPTPPETEAPSTPRANPLTHSRTGSLTLTLGKQGSVGAISNASASATTPFSNNVFTTVPPTFGAPPSPTRAGFGSGVKGRMKRRSQSRGSAAGAAGGKRKREEGAEGGEAEVKKRK